MMADQWVEHRYVTDDRDREERPELIVAWGPNGDFYIGSNSEEGGYNTRLVRICNSGGCSTRNPKLRDAVRAVFMALGGWGAEQVTLSEPAEAVKAAVACLMEHHEYALAARLREVAAEVLGGRSG